MPEFYGYLAAICVLTSSTFDKLFVVRLASLLSNFFFIIYAAHAGLMPVFILHALLLPINGCKVLAFFTTPNVPEVRQVPESARRSALKQRRSAALQKTSATARARGARASLQAPYGTQI